MIEFSAHCIKCGLDIGVESIHYDMMWKHTFIKLNCGHIVKVFNNFRYVSDKEYAEAFPDEK